MLPMAGLAVRDINSLLAISHFISGSRTPSRSISLTSDLLIGGHEAETRRLRCHARYTRENTDHLGRAASSSTFAPCPQVSVRVKGH